MELQLRSRAKKQVRAADVLVLALPHLGIVDSWLPVITDLKRKCCSISICAIAPDMKRLKRLRTEDSLLASCEQVIDRVISRRYGEGWGSHATFEAAARHAQEYEKHICSRYIEALQCRFPKVAGLIDNQTPRSKIVLFDIKERATFRGMQMQNVLADAAWFSLPHGIDPRLSRQRLGKQRAKALMPRTKVFASSQAEAAIYREAFGLEEANVAVVGVPRHERRWLIDLEHNYRADVTRLCLNNFVFVASRPSDPESFPEKRKIQAIKDVKKLAEQLGCTLVIRLHPSESVKDKRFFEHILGKERLGHTWELTSLPAMLAGSKALLAVTFFSSVAVDMVAVDVPVIELADFSGLTQSRTLVLDPFGRLTSVYRICNLVIGANDFAELEAAARYILADREAAVAKLKSAYAKVYAEPEGSIDTISGEIMATLSQNAHQTF